MIDQLAEVRRFNPDQLAGLHEIGWNFGMVVRPVSVGELYQNNATRQSFNYVTGAKQIKDSIPVAGEVFINLNRPPLLTPGDLSFGDASEVIDQAAWKLKKRPLKSGTLDGIKFGAGYASVIAQLYLELQMRFNGSNPFPYFISRAKEAYMHPDLGLVVAALDRYAPGDRLSIRGWACGNGCPVSLQTILVATP